jgi:hypothetical protein
VSDNRLDRVSTFGDQLSFLIPHDWVEFEEEQDHYLYHAPDADSGWFRVSLLTLRQGDTSRAKLHRLLADRAYKEHGQLYESGENIVAAWEQFSEQNGVPICNYWWAVAYSHSASLGHEALFSYTILRERRTDPRTQQTVDLLANLVSDARFSPDTA